MSWLSWTVRLGIAVAIVGLGVFYILPLLNADDILGALFALNPVWLFIVCPFAILAVWSVRALRWRICLEMLGAPQPFQRTYLMIGSVLGLAAITPLQSGEAVKVLNLPKGQDRAKATGLFALERLTDLGFLGLIALVGILAAGFEVGVWQIVIALAVLAGMAVIAALLVSRKMRIVRDALSVLQEAASKPIWLAQFFLLSGVAWVATLLLWWAAFQACGIALTTSELALVLGLATIANIVSVIPGSLGVSEASVASLLILQGIEPAIAVTAALAIRVTGLEILGLGALHFLLLKRFGAYIVWREDTP